MRDVGQAVDGPENVNIAAWKNDKPGVILVVFKQPGANVIDTVDQIKETLPQLADVIPPAIQVETILDRTETIRASVRDVEFTLGLTIALVVMVIFLFLRNVAATVIPSITVPLSLLGATAIMYLAGFSLDNLSLMALTIAVGFVVDDAIVVVENIYRHIEDGLSAARGGAQGRARDRLHRSVDQPLADRGVHSAPAHGRHRRAAVPRIRDHGDDRDRRCRSSSR